MLMSLGLVEKSQFRTTTFGPQDRVSIGLDVARFGSNKTVMTRFDGCQETKRKVMVKRDTTQIAGELIQELSGITSTDVHVCVDATGLGAGVVDALLQAQREGLIKKYVEIREVHFGSAPGQRDKEKVKFFNLKARVYVELAEDLKTKLCLLDESVYLEELPTIQYRFDSKGKWCVESKEEYSKRTGRLSPDDADSLALANYARYDRGDFGKFTENMVPKTKTTIAPARGGSNPW